MTLFRSNMALGKRPVPSLNSALVAGLLYGYKTEATAPAAGDIIELGNLEADVRPVDIKLISDKLDINAAPAIQLTIGILNAAKTDIDAAATSTWLATSNVAKNGGVDRTASAAPFLSGRSSAARVLGVKVVTAPATWVGAGKELVVMLSAGG